MSIQTPCKQVLVVANDCTNGYPMVYLIIIHYQTFASFTQLDIEKCCCEYLGKYFSLFLVTPSEYTSGFRFKR